MTTGQQTPAVQRIATGLGAIALLGLVLIGLPWALWTLGGNPLPDHIPTGSQVLGALTSPDDGTLFRAALTIVGWIGWASWAGPIVVQIISTLAGIRVPRLGGLRMQQRHAAALVAAVAAMASMGGAGVAHATPAPPISSPAAAAPTTTPAAAAKPVAATSTSTAATAQESTQAATTRIQIHPGDTLWELAEEHLGEGSRFPEIFAASKSITQPDGRRVTNPDLIYPGWTMSMPTPAGQEMTKAHPAPAKPANPSQHQGEPSAPAPSATTKQDVRGAAPAPTAPAQQPTPAATPFTPSARAPQQVAPQSTADSEPQRERPSAAPSPTGATSVTPPADSSTTSSAAVPVPAPALPSATTAPTPQASSTASQPARDAQASTTASANIASGSINPVFATVAGLSSLAAAGLLGVLATQRRRQSRHRRPGERVLLPAGEAAVAESQLRAAADPVAVADLDRALRTLAANAVDTDVVLPQVRAALLTPQAIELYLVEEEGVLPAPFTQDDPGIWVMDRSLVDQAFLSEEDAAEYAPPFPALVSLGADLEDGGHLMLNLEAVGSLGLIGRSEVCHEVMTALAIELVTAAWSDSARITLVGLLPELMEVLGADRVQYVPDIEEALPALTHLASEYRISHENAGAASTLEARCRGVLDPMWSPHIVLISDHLAPEDRDQLQQLVDDIPTIAVAAITTGQAGGDWQLHLHRSSEGIEGELQPSGMHITAQRLALEDYFATIGAISPSEPIVPGPAWTEGLHASVPDLDDMPDPDDDEGLHLVDDLEGGLPEQWHDATQEQDESATTPAPAPATESSVQEEPTAQNDLHSSRTWSHTADLATEAIPLIQDDPPTQEQESAPLQEDLDDELDAGQVIALPAGRPKVRLLGPVEITGTAQQRPRSPGVVTEAVAYLAMRPGLNETAFTEAVHPPKNGKVTKPASVRQRRNTIMYMARAWLGNTPTGEPYVPIVDSENPSYGLHEDVIVDWNIWCELTGGDAPVSQTPTSNLIKALHLVEGMPLSGIGENRWAWAQPLKTMMCAAVGDVAHEVAARALSDGDARTAFWAAEKGLAAEPVNEALWRAAITAAWRLGDRARTQETIQRAEILLDDFGDELEPETVELIDEITRRDQLAHA